MNKQFREKREEMMRELQQIGEMRRGTINEVFKRCGRPNCACSREDHPGHGPIFTLTHKEKGVTKTKSLPNAAAVKLAKQQIENHRRFLEWSKKWVKLNEEASDLKLEQALSGEESEPTSRKKKSRRRSSRRSGGKSKS